MICFPIDPSNLDNATRFTNKEVLATQVATSEVALPQNDEWEEGVYFTTLYRARQTTDDFGSLVRVVAPQYHNAAMFYRT